MEVTLRIALVFPFFKVKRWITISYGCETRTTGKADRLTSNVFEIGTIDAWNKFGRKSIK